MEEQNSTDVSTMSAQLKRIEDHLRFLEKKLDTLLEQSQSQNRRPYNPGFGGGDRPNRGYRPNRGPGGYPPRHSGHSSGPNRYQGNRGPRPEQNGNRAEHASQGSYQKKYTPHRGSR